MDETDYRLIKAARDALDMGDAHSAMKALDEFIVTKPQLEAKSLSQRCEEGRDALRQDYYNDVNGVADDIVQRWKSGDFDGSREAVTDAIDEDCGGHSRCSRTNEIFETLLFSSNEEAYKDHTDEASFETMAYYAFKQDVYDAVAAEVDLSIRPPSEGDKQCPSCDEYKPGEDFNGEDCAECSELNGNARCDDCEKWFAEDDLDSGLCGDCRGSAHAKKEAASG